MVLFTAAWVTFVSLPLSTLASWAGHRQACTSASLTTNKSFPVSSPFGPEATGIRDNTSAFWFCHNIIRKHSINFRCYADDTQLYPSIKPNVTNHLSKLQACLNDIKTWMTGNILLLNSDKTEVIVLGPKHLQDTLSEGIVTLDGIVLAF